MPRVTSPVRPDQDPLPDIAIADGKWELRGVLDPAGKPLPMMEGQVSLLLKRTGGWLIEAYRYTLTPTTAGSTAPTPLRRGPGGAEPAPE